MSQNEEKSTKDLEWEKRILCSDESCIGTIGQDGKCRVCGLPYEGTLPEGLGAGDGPQENEAVPEENTGEPAEAEPESQKPQDESDEDDAWERRTLCSDGNCIGVIGPDGRCKECGKPYQG